MRAGSWVQRAGKIGLTWPSLLQLCALLLLLRGPAPLYAGGPIPPIESGYGARGPYSPSVQTVPSPLWPERQVSVFAPAGLGEPAPVVFFSHGFGGNEPTYYMPLIEHIVSRGYVLVFSPYPSSMIDPDDWTKANSRYNILFAGFKAAATHLGERMDLTRVGFVGHSFGGGATPALAWRGLVGEGWGRNGAMLFLLAPWCAYELTQDHLANFPPGTKMVVQVYDQDTVNDHRMAIDIFRSIGIPKENKDYLIVYSDSEEGYTLQADHYVPVAPGPQSPGEEDALDYYAVYKVFDGLADYAFAGSNEGRLVGLGNGSREQTSMGQWPGGPAVTPMVEQDDPVASHPQGYFVSRWDNLLNPRRSVQPGQHYLYLPQVAAGSAAGAGIRTALYFRNAGEGQSVSLEFFDHDGKPMSVDLGSGGHGNQLDLDFSPEQSRLLETLAAGPLQAGYARLTLLTQLASTSVFSSLAPGGSDISSEAGIPASDTCLSFGVFVDTVGDKDSGIAIVNPPRYEGEPGTGYRDAHLAVTLQDLAGSVIGETHLSLPAGERLARFVWEIFAGEPAVAAKAKEMSGFLKIRSDQPLAAVTLRQRFLPGGPTLTAFPVVRER